MVSEQFMFELQVVRLENALLLAANHFDDCGYSNIHDSIFNDVRKLDRGPELSPDQLSRKYAALSVVLDKVLSIISDDKDVELIKELLILRLEFPNVHKSYFSNSFFGRLKSEQQKHHRVCGVASFSDVRRILETGIFPRGM